MGGGHERQVGGEDHDGIRKGRVGSGRQGLDGGGQAGHGTAAGHALEHDAYALRDALARAHDERRAVAGGVEHARDERSAAHVEHRLVRAHAP